ncbi:MAG: hypothetical protein PHD95_06645 [Candidatus ainarchaeum sp.]|nr:hypothetical protein [Candidatus ainarchaeum sp.]
MVRTRFFGKSWTREMERKRVARWPARIRGKTPEQIRARIARLSEIRAEEVSKEGKLEKNILLRKQGEIKLHKFFQKSLFCLWKKDWQEEKEPMNCCSMKSGN